MITYKFITKTLHITHQFNQTTNKSSHVLPSNIITQIKWISHTKWR